ncbi:MAG: apolipoprotein N-acyltransferase [Actinomycetota bacterium]
MDLGPLAFVALVPLALVFRNASAKRVALGSAAFGATFLALLFPWIHLFGLAAYLLLVGLETAFITAFLTLGTLLRNRLPRPVRLLAFPLALLAGEYVRSNFPLGGFPWGGLGYSQHNNFITLRVAAYAGVWGVSLVVALVNALLAEALVAARSSPPGALVRLAAALALIVAPAMLPVSAPKGSVATLALVQGNAPLQDPSHRHALDQQALDNQVSLTAMLAGKKVALVVWPESSLGHDPFADPALLEPLLASIRQADVPFVVGATIALPASHGNEQFRNESLFFNKDASLAGRYVKMHLVPFGEYVPARHLLAGWIKELNRVPADGIPGKAPQVFSLPEGTFGTVICYETAYPNLVGSFVRKGARMIVVSTDNSSYRRSAASAQLVIMSQLRAAEQRMWVSQAALTGVSAVIAPDGRVVSSAGLFQPALLTPTVRFATGATVYGRYGDWLPMGVLLLGAIFFAATVLPAARARVRR